MQEAKKFEDIRKIVSSEFKSHTKDKNFPAILNMSEYLFKNFVYDKRGETNTPDDNLNSKIALYYLGRVIENIIENSNGQLPLHCSSEVFVDQRDLYNATLRLTNLAGGINLIYFSGRDGNKYKDYVDTWRADIFKISRGETI